MFFKGIVSIMLIDHYAAIFSAKIRKIRAQVIYTFTLSGEPRYCGLISLKLWRSLEKVQFKLVMIVGCRFDRWHEGQPILGPPIRKSMPYGRPKPIIEVQHVH
jgi:hypothetical protein